MSMLIKSGNLTDLSSVRPLAALPPAAVMVSAAEEESRRLHRRIAALEKDAQELEAVTEALHEEVEHAYKEGQEQGRTMGFAEAEDRQSARLMLLENAMRRAQSELSGGLVSLERLAALLARDCLEMILGDPDDRIDVLGDIIRTQLAKIDKAMLLGIKLSQEDFHGAEGLAALAGQVGLPSVVLSASADMPSGGCVMTLRLGSMDVGINQQWGTLRDLLGQIALPDEVQ